MNAEQAHILKKIVFSGNITALTGLHIGGSEVGLQIGGADKVVVRNPNGNVPYVPGSSLKGRMRSLLERVYCLGQDHYEPAKRGGETVYGPCGCANCDICRLFGVAISEQNKDRAQAGRLLVRDAMMTNCGYVKQMPNLLTDYTELKTEVSIDRLTSAANPRNFERVPPGAKFGFELVLNVFQGDQEDKFVALVEEGLRLVAYDALGGQSSRGYGRVRIELSARYELKVDDFSSDEKLRAALDKNLMPAPQSWPAPDSAREPQAA
jgi:CRISPR-associated protein Csm3